MLATALIKHLHYYKLNSISRYNITNLFKADRLQQQCSTAAIKLLAIDMVKRVFYIEISVH